MTVNKFHVWIQEQTVYRTTQVCCDPFVKKSGEYLLKHDMKCQIKILYIEVRTNNYIVYSFYEKYAADSWLLELETAWLDYKTRLVCLENQETRNYTCSLVFGRSTERAGITSSTDLTSPSYPSLKMHFHSVSLSFFHSQHLDFRERYFSLLMGVFDDILCLLTLVRLSASFSCQYHWMTLFPCEASSKS